MAITQASLTSGSSTANQTSYTTASITPTGSRLVIVSVTNAGDDGVAPTLSGNGLTWAQIDTQTFDVIGKRLTVFRSMGASPSTGAITIDFAGNTQAGCAWSVFEFDGIDTGGTNGSAAVGDTDKAEVLLATSITLSLSFASASNGACGAFAIDDNVAMTPDPNFAEIHEVQVNDGADSMTNETQWIATNETSPSVSWTGNLQGAGIAFEIIAAGGVVAAVPMRALMGAGT